MAIATEPEILSSVTLAASEIKLLGKVSLRFTILLVEMSQNVTFAVEIRLGLVLDDAMYI